MLKIVLLLVLTLTLYASNPKIYAALGDLIYNNEPKISKLAELQIYRANRETIENYSKEVQRVKEMGMLAEKSKDKKLQKEYLIRLRKLSKENDFFIRSANKNYEKALQTQQSEDFVGLVNSGLIETNARKEEILNYYYEHKEEIDLTGVLEEYVKEDKELKKKRDIKSVKKRTKEALAREKIERIRKNDLEAQKRLELRLQEELTEKKSAIRKDQAEALKN